MKLTGHACTETLSEAEKAGTRKRTPGNAGGVRVERRVRPANPNDAHRARAMLVSARMGVMAIVRERRFMLPSPKEKN